MKNADVFKQFAKYASLSVLGMVGMSCYILADTFFVSKGLGTNGLAALNLAIPAYNVIHGAGLMLGIGGATKFSVYKSRGEHEKANEVFTNTLYLAAAFSLLFVLLGALLSGNIARALGAENEVFSMTDTYLKVLLLFSPAFLLNDVLICFTRNDGDPRLAMLATLSGSLSNILLDYVFIFPCKMGMFGAVFATGLAPVIGICVSSVRFLRGKNGFRPVKARPRGKQAATCFALGFPSFVEQLSSAVVMIAFNAIILRLLGNMGVAAYGVVANISLVVLSVFTGIAQGAQPLVSRSHGEGDGKKSQALFACSALASLIFSAAVYAVIFAFALPIAEIFNSAGDPNLGAIASDGLRLYFIATPFAGFNVILCSFFAATEKPLPAHILSLLRGLALILPAAFLFSWLWGITGVWLSFPAAEAATALAGAALFAGLRKKLFRSGAEKAEEKDQAAHPSD
ncbi:MAG TPA: MATE family efflux transporter [Candidatus Borkfalkia avistercoris]|uniref:Multidrug export protein MepA n=1 Tax=Candidatus Borkfalkia avistercoris TaxID=2838504 RepID=A0A9D2CYH1_9FIRM|nr:MATE family efflux transporter [Candidatus Borkfalkia avistercoris]